MRILIRMLASAGGAVGLLLLTVAPSGASAAPTLSTSFQAVSLLSTGPNSTAYGLTTGSSPAGAVVSMTLYSAGQVSFTLHELNGSSLAASGFVSIIDSSTGVLYANLGITSATGGLSGLLGQGILLTETLTQPLSAIANACGPLKSICQLLQPTVYSGSVILEPNQIP